jgi:hypothetical protein
MMGNTYVHALFHGCARKQGTPKHSVLKQKQDDVNVKVSGIYIYHYAIKSSRNFQPYC